jgi:uncharacterized protein (TIGR02145 family)
MKRRSNIWIWLSIVIVILSSCKKEEVPNLTYGKVTDIEGNIYKTITIGTQTWMAENLKTIKYDDGTAISLVTDGAAWTALTTPAYCWNNNDADSYKNIYGALYNRYTVNTLKLCPIGWHVPSESEWDALISFLGGKDIAGGKLKETGTELWTYPNAGATNEIGFTALPSSPRDWDGNFFDHSGWFATWWSTGIYNDAGQIYGWAYNTNYHSTHVEKTFYPSRTGLSVRCIKD